ncbi:helix-turn-helix domain-containing protein [Amycolatopsis sp. NBC_01480]|uniref:helix-turn-helix domain-containing protein n=1 Tax=Amycolatopsis sp. NBC_01480 TaxID=2903562 RepID=UPI002E2D234D|nr:helix-turn-helix transcriptional regulator [Amycolatopsis sp. NBC_01480]
MTSPEPPASPSKLAFVDTVPAFKDRLRALIQQSGLTAGKIAAASGMPRSTAYSLTDVNRSSLPTSDSLQTILDVCAVDDEQVVEWQDALTRVRAMANLTALTADAKINELAAELKALRKGLGIQAPNLPDHVGARLRQVCGVQDGDSSGTVRDKVSETMRSLITRLPKSQWEVARLVFGIGTPPGQRYTDRLAMLGDSADRNARTMQRRADDVVYLIAEIAYAAPAPFGQPARTGRKTPWHTSALAVRLTFGPTGAEVFETRRIISHVDGLEEIEHAISLTRPLQPSRPLPTLEGLGIDVVAGGEVHSVRMVSSTRVAFRLRPPSSLDTGEQHEFFFRIRVDEFPSPFYCCTPEYPCESFDLNVRFDRGRPPTKVWRIDGEFSMDAEDPLAPRKPLWPDNAAEVHTSFHDLEPARSYGLGWQPADGTAGGLHTH